MQAPYEYKSVSFAVGEGCFDHKGQVDYDKLKQQGCAQTALLEKLKAEGWERATIEKGQPLDTERRRRGFTGLWSEETYLLAKRLPLTPEIRARLIERAYNEAYKDWHIAELLNDTSGPYRRLSYKTICFDDEKGHWNEQAKDHDERIIRIREAARDRILSELVAHSWEIIRFETKPGMSGGVHGQIVLRREPFDRAALKDIVQDIMKELRADA